MAKVSEIKFALISVIGPHAGELENVIFNRKIQDIQKIGKTFWLIKSHLAKPQMVNDLCLKAKAENTDSYCIFIDASSKGAAIPTKTALIATRYSHDNINWNNLPKGLSPVTGKIDKGTYALVFDSLELITDGIDLWKYSDFFNLDNPITIRQGASTICAIKKDSSHHPKRINSHDRNIIAIGRLSKPFCVYLK